MRSVALLALSLAACTPAPEPEPEPPPDEPGPLQRRFSFAVLADPHISSNTKHAERTRQTVQWVADNVEEFDIELAVVLGDIGWGPGLTLSREILDELPIPYVPILGDNEVQFGDEANFDVVYGPVLDSLAEHASDLHRGPVEVYLPAHDHDASLQNLAFTWRGVHFLGLDWNARVFGGLLSELGDLHDVEGGSLGFLGDQLASLPEPSETNDVVLLSHIPMHIPAWTQDEMGQVGELTLPRQDRIWANYAGHYHGDGHEEVEEGGYDAIVTDAVWDDVVTVRLVEVFSNGAAFEYRDSLHTW